ncbi:MAG TPA: hypothetical protein VMH40_20075 [Myxococcaceae bacterium]|nr:hypothetical protein [Myxococcaceae bacterium]
MSIALASDADPGCSAQDSDLTPILRGPGTAAAEAMLKRALGLALVLLVASPAYARGGSHGGHVRVGGYTTRRGTYVAPHYRTHADSTRSNNWSHSGNVNPYTGKPGHKL